jgi:hypothetical protein
LEVFFRNRESGQKSRKFSLPITLFSSNIKSHLKPLFECLFGRFDLIIDVGEIFGPGSVDKSGVIP